MSNWLQRIASVPAKVVKTNLPAAVKASLPQNYAAPQQPQVNNSLPPACVVYGAAAGAFVAFAIYLLISHHWIEGILTFLPAACFVGFAVHILKHSQPRR